MILKKNILEIASYYDIDQNNNLYIKYYYNKDKDINKKQNKKNVRKKFNNYKLMRIPFEKDILKYLYKMHSKTAHRGIDSLRKYLIINHCSICKLKNNKFKIMKKEKFNLIVFNRPKIRYIGDLSVIPLELINNERNVFYEKNKQYKYIFTIIEHFSKLSDSFLLTDKKKLTILNNLKKFIEYYGKSFEFGCDNGREFINPLISNYLNANNIKMVNGLPYNPRSQGTVERIHITIRNSLLSLYLENINSFDIENALFKTMNVYNKSIHRITKFSPIEVFYSTNEDLFKLIKNNIIDNFKNINKSEINFKNNEKVLLINNFIKTKHKTKNGHIILSVNKVKKRCSFCKICAEILEYTNGGNYLINIVGNYNSYNIFNNEKYCVNLNMLRKCDLKTWENLNKLNNSNLIENNLSDTIINYNEEIDSEDIENFENNMPNIKENLYKDENSDDFISKYIKWVIVQKFIIVYIIKNMQIISKIILYLLKLMTIMKIN